MTAKGRTVAVLSAAVLLAAGVFCGEEKIPWEERASYILSTDTISKIYVHDNTGAVVGSLSPLSDTNMRSIHSPILIGKAEKVAFLSRLSPQSNQLYLCITDPSGEELDIRPIVNPDHLDGSPTALELVYTTAATHRRISLVNVSSGSVKMLFSDTAVESESVGTIFLDQTLEPAFSPDGSQIAFINVGSYYDSTSNPPQLQFRTDMGLVERDGSGYRLLTGHLSNPLPDATWLQVCWTHDGKWILAFTKANDAVGEVYAVSTEDGRVFAIGEDHLKAYCYVTASPTGDTLLLGTAPSHADLYVVEFNGSSAMPSVGFEVSRLTESQIFAEPDWGPGE